jgi:hypothetical protein
LKGRPADDEKARDGDGAGLFRSKNRNGFGGNVHSAQGDRKLVSGVADRDGGMRDGGHCDKMRREIVQHLRAAELQRGTEGRREHLHAGLTFGIQVEKSARGLDAAGSLIEAARKRYPEHDRRSQDDDGP